MFASSLQKIGERGVYANGIVIV